MEKDKKEEKKKDWFIHAEFVVLFVTLIGGFYLIDSKIERQGYRTDKLYEMYCQMQKEIKDIYISWNNKNK